MSQLVSDDFNRANASGAGALGAAWTDVTDGFNISSNTAITRTAGVDNNDMVATSFWAGGGADQYSQCTVQAASGEVGPTTRNDASENCYIASCEGSLGSSITHNLIRSSAGAFTTIASFTGTITAGDTLRCEAQGSTIGFLQNGVSKASVTNTAIATGRPGIFGFGTGSTIDNFAAGDFALVHPFNNRTTRPRPFAPGLAR